jgi:Polyglycine hydrolase-like, structural repeat
MKEAITMTRIVKILIVGIACSGVFADFVLAEALALPFKADDLKNDEAYRTVVHIPGIQALGKDVNGFRYKSGGQWSFFTSDYDKANPKPKKENIHFVIFGKPFYAMASGVVIGCWRNAPDNNPGSVHRFVTDGLVAGGGNHLWIQQDDGNIALYAHAKKGSIPASICPNNAERFTKPSSGAGRNPDVDPNVALPAGKRVRVTKGQKLGLVGNSGASKGGPHLHVHLEKNNKPVAIILERGLYQTANGKVELNGKWQTLRGGAWPEKTIIFWPPHTLWAKATWNGIPGPAFQSWFDHWADSGYMADTIGCRQAGKSVIFDTTWVPAKGAWLAYAGITPADYQEKKTNAVAKGFKETAHYTCTTSGGQLKCAVFRKP